MLAVLLAVCCAACGKNAASSASDTANGTEMSVACIKGPTGVGFCGLMDRKDTRNNYKFTVAASADEISGKIVSGEINIASVPTNLAVKLYNKTGGKLKILAVNTLGVLSIIENGGSIHSVADLKGKTVYSIGEGSNPEYILRYILAQNGIDSDKDVNLQFLATNDELVAALVSGKADVAMIPEPAATTVLSKKETLRRALSMNDEWEKVSDSRLMMGCVVALKSFTDAHPEAVAAFLDEYKSSVESAISDVKNTALLCEKYDIIPSAAIAEAAIPSCNLTFVAGKDIKENIEGYYEVLFAANPSSIGGKLPKSDFYYANE